MAEYPAPREIVPIYNPENFTTLDTALTIIDADGRYLKLTGGTETGLVTFNQGLTIPLTTNSTSSITGALICAGGLGLAQDFYTGGNLFLSGSSKRIYNQFGTAAAPSYSFSSNTNTGMYRMASNNIGFATNGVLRFDVSTSAVTSTLPYIAPLGTVGAPALSFSGDLDTGIYSPGANQIALATGGAARLTCLTSTISAGIPISIPNGIAAGPAINFTSDTSTGMYSPTSKQIGFSCDGSLRLTLSSSSLTSTVPYIAPVGSSSSCSLQFSGDADTGVYSPSDNTVDLCAGGGTGLRVSTSAVTFYQPLSYATGNVLSGSIASGVNVNITYSNLVAGRTYGVSVNVSGVNTPHCFCIYSPDQSGGVGNGRLSILIQSGMTIALTTSSPTALTVTINQATGSTLTYRGSIIRLI